MEAVQEKPEQFFRMWKKEEQRENLETLIRNCRWGIKVCQSYGSVPSEFAILFDTPEALIRRLQTNLEHYLQELQELDKM